MNTPNSPDKLTAASSRRVANVRSAHALTGTSPSVAGRAVRRFLALTATVLAALTLAGCSSPPGRDLTGIVAGEAAHAAAAATQISRQLIRSWCPPALAHGGRELTSAQARGCLRRASNGWLAELRAHRDDPSRVASDR